MSRETGVNGQTDGQQKKAEKHDAMYRWQRNNHSSSM